MKSATIFSILCAAASVVARQRVIFGTKGQTNVTLPTPSPISRVHRRTSLYQDSPSSLFDWQTHQLTYNVHKGEVVHDPTGFTHDISTVIRFYIPVETRGHTCKLRLQLDGSPESIVNPAGSATAVYQIHDNVPMGNTLWTIGPERLVPNGYLGVLTAQKGQDSVEELIIDCNTYAGSNIALEFAPILSGPASHIAWNDDVVGPYILATTW